MYKCSRAEVYAAVDSEIAYADAMSVKAHGDPSEEGRKKLEQFVLYMDDYMRELKTGLARTWGPSAYEAALHTTRKVVALGVRAMEIHGAPLRTSPTKHEAGTDLV